MEDFGYAGSDSDRARTRPRKFTYRRSLSPLRLNVGFIIPIRNQEALLAGTETVGPSTSSCLSLCHSKMCVEPCAVRLVLQLCLRFCDLGSPQHFAYPPFIRLIDGPATSAASAVASSTEAGGPNRAPLNSVYFRDGKQQLHATSDESPPLWTVLPQL